MTGLNNFTRWNRMGLEKFRYIDGNAATYLEDMRQHLATSFPDWGKVNGPISSDESIDEKRERLESQYFGPRGEWAWEIMRTFARSNHILLEHIDAFANEGYLSTATQWEYLRRLVEMLDYRPSPPASASTLIALLCKDEATPGLVKKGLQLAYQPDEGDRLIFESLNDIVVHPILDQLRLHGYDHNPEKLNPFKTFDDEANWMAAEDHELDQGQPAILVQGTHALSVSIESIDKRRIKIKETDNRSPLGHYIKGDTVLLTEFDAVYNCALNGRNVSKRGADFDLSTGDVVGIQTANGYGFARIGDADRFGYRLENVEPNSLIDESLTGSLYRPTSLSQKQFKANDNQWRVPYNSRYNLIGIESDGMGELGPVQNLSVSDVKADGLTTHGVINSILGHDIHFMDLNDLHILTQFNRYEDDKTLYFEGGAGQLRSGDVIVAEGKDKDNITITTALEILELKEFEDSFLLRLERSPENFVEIKRIYGPFKTEIRAIGADRNPSRANTKELLLELSQSETPEILSAGRWILIEPESKIEGVEPFKAKISDVDFETSSDHRRLARITLEKVPSLFERYSVGNVIIRANTVECGHGKTKSIAVMGSGDATQNNQSILIEADDLTYIPDPAIETGVRADILVVVEDQFYSQVSDLTHASPTEPSYEIRITEEGFTRVIFGDGINARRLPSGPDNILMTLRQGTGGSGNNVPPYSLEKLSTPHAIIDVARQPLTTSGGQDRENTEQIRKNAPSHLKALGRAVSLSDFEHLARATPGIWHAKAFEGVEEFQRQTIIEVCVVPVDGAPLGDLEQSLSQRLNALSMPNINVVITPFEPVHIDLHIILRIDHNQFDPLDIETNVRARLFEELKLEKRSLGVPLFLSHIYSIVEMTDGVTNSHIRLFGNKVEDIISSSGTVPERITRDSSGAIVTIRPTNRQTIFLTSVGAISIRTEEVLL